MFFFYESLSKIWKVGASIKYGKAPGQESEDLILHLVHTREAKIENLRIVHW